MTRRRPLTRWAGAALATALVLLAAATLDLSQVDAQTGADPLTFWMSPRGSDTASGTSRDQPVRTLARVHKTLCPTASCTGLGRPVEVRIEPGIYTGAGLTWRYFDDQHPTRFMPADYQLGQGWPEVDAAGGRPVFDGRHASLSGMVFLQSRQSSTGRTNLQFWYLEWRNWLRNGLHIAVSTDLPSARAEGNLVYGSYFSRIGNYWTNNTNQGYGGVSVARADRNTIRNNHFVDILNRPAERGQEHGIYLINARHTEVSANRFERIGGDAVRVRNDSSHTIVEANRFIQAGGHGYVGDWYCTPSHVSRGACAPVESPSLSVALRGNTFSGLYQGGVSPTAIAFCYDIQAACPARRATIS
jgi:hypothetical protein